MRSAFWVLIAAACGVAGLLVGRWTARPDAEVTSDGAASPAPETGAPPPALASAPRAGTETADGITHAFRELIARIPLDEGAQGKGAISGTVRTESGDPLQGVVVTVAPREPPPSVTRRRDGSSAKDPAESVRAFAEMMAWERAAQRTATTDAAGAYRVEGLADVALSVYATLAGWRIQQTEAPGRPVRAGAALVHFVAKPITGVRFDLRLPNGSAPSQAMLEIHSPGMNWNYVWVPDMTPPDLEPGTYKVKAHCDDGGQFASESIDAIVEAGKPTTVRVELRERPGIRVHLRWPAGERFPNASLRHLELAAGDKPDPTALERAPEPANRGGDGSDGDLRTIPDIEPGRYLIGVRRYEGGPIAASAVVEVGAGLTELELAIPPIDRATYVLVRVLGPDRRPVVGALVQTSMRSSTGGFSGGGTVLERPDGALWVIPRPWNAPGADARHWITASTTAYGTRSAEYRWSAAPEVTLQFEAPARVEVAFEGAPELKLRARLLVTIEPTDEGAKDMGRSQGERLTRDGIATLTPIQPGEYEVLVSVTSGEHDYRGATLHRAAASIRSGPQRITVALPALYAVTVRAKAGGVMLQKDGDSRFHLVVNAGSDGVALFEALPAGTYQVRASDRKATFTLPGATEVDAR